METLKFMRRPGVISQSPNRDGTLIVQRPHQMEAIIGDIDLRRVSLSCPSFAASFKPLDSGRICHIDGVSLAAITSLLRWTYTGDYLPPTIRAADVSLVTQLEIVRLADAHAAPSLKSDALVGVAHVFHQACSLPTHPPHLTRAIEIIYKHHSNDQGILSLLINYCNAHLVRHNLLSRLSFNALLHRLPMFHQDMSVASVIHTYRVEDGKAFIQIGAHCLFGEKLPDCMARLPVDHPLHPEWTRIMRSAIPVARAAMVTSLLKTPKAETQGCPSPAVSCGSTGPEPKAAALPPPIHAPLVLLPVRRIVALADWQHNPQQQRILTAARAPADGDQGTPTSQEREGSSRDSATATASESTRSVGDGRSTKPHAATGNSSSSSAATTTSAEQTPPRPSGEAAALSDRINRDWKTVRRRHLPPSLSRRVRDTRAADEDYAWIDAPARPAGGASSAEEHLVLDGEYCDLGRDMLSSDSEAEVDEEGVVAI